MDIAFEYYEILNSIKSNVEKAHDPYDLAEFIRKGEIKPTYKEIELKYIKGQNFFQSVKKENKQAQKPIKTKTGGYLEPTDMILVFST